MTTFSYAGSFIDSGAGVNGATVSAYKASRFSTPPIKDANPPVGAADATATTDSDYGSDGAFVLEFPTPESYYIVVTHSGVKYWQGPVYGASLADVAGLPAAGNVLTATSTDTADWLPLDTTVFDVTAYGAVADSNGTHNNGTDNTTAIEAAIAAMEAAGGGILFFPAPPVAGKHYRVTASALSITASNCHVRGVGPGISSVFFDNSVWLVMTGFLFDGGETSGTIENVSIKDITVFNYDDAIPIPGGDSWDGTGCKVTMRGCEGFIVENVEVHHALNYCIVMLRSSHGTVLNCYCHDTGKDGIHVLDDCQYITIMGNHVHDTLDDQISVGCTAPNHGVSDVIIVGNTCYNSSYNNIDVMATATNVIIANNICNGAVCGNIRVNATVINGTTGAGPISNVIIEGNMCRGAGLGDVTVSGANDPYNSPGGVAPIQVSPGGPGIDRVLIKGNSIYESSWSSIAITSSAPETDPGRSIVSNLRIIDNVMEWIKANADNWYDAPAILIRGCDAPIISGNRVKNAISEGLLADRHNEGPVVVRDNLFEGCNLSPFIFNTKYAYKVSSGIPVCSGNIVTNSIGLGDKSLTNPALDDNNIVVNSGLEPGDHIFASDTMVHADGTIAGLSGQVGGQWANVGGAGYGHRISGNGAVADSYVAGHDHRSVVILGGNDNGKGVQAFAQADITLAATPERVNNGVFILSGSDANHSIKGGIYYDTYGGDVIKWQLWLVCSPESVLNDFSGTITPSIYSTLTGGSTHTIAVRLINNTVYMILDGVPQGCGGLTNAEMDGYSRSDLYYAGIHSYTDAEADDGTVKFTNFVCSN